jgi:hypothetical protein
MTLPLQTITFVLSSVVPMLLAVGSTCATERGDALDRQVQDLLKAKCVQCHDDRKAAAAGGVDNLLKLDELASGYLDKNDMDSVEDLLLGEKPRMPKQRLGKDLEWNGPLTVNEKKVLKDWVERGGPSADYLAAGSQPNRTRFSEKQITDRIVADLTTLTGTTLRNARYLTLTNLSNNLSISDDDLEIYREGLVKMLNSLSRSSDILGIDKSSAVNRLVAVDGERTIFRLDLSDIGWQDSDWERVIRHYPYALKQRGGRANSLYSSTSSELPVVRADWFVFATSQPPLYHDLVGIKPQLHELERDLGLDRVAAIRERRVQRSGMVDSQVSIFNNRLIERIPLSSRAGTYHISYDFASNIDRQNFFENPLGPVGVFKTEFAFQHDGGEVIYNLPNGFQAYALVTAAGARLNIAPQNIVADASMPGSVIINGISCIACHFQGVKPERGDKRLASLDEVRTAAEENRRRFSEDDLELIRELYPLPEKFQALMEQDRKRFLDAQATAGIRTDGNTEPVRALFDRFAKDLDLNAVAADFGLSPEECKTQMNRETETRQHLLRIEKGTLNRLLYLDSFRLIARLTGAGDTREFSKLQFPYFGENVPDDVAVGKLEPTTASPTWARTGVDLIDAEHRTGAFNVTMRTENDQRTFLENDPVRCQVRATEDCFLTILTIDPVGDVTLLLPNRWHPEFKLKAGQTVTLPTPDMGFEFPAAPPHGATILKVVATKRPLKLKGVDATTLTEKGLVPLGRGKAIGLAPRPSSAETVAKDDPPMPVPPANEAPRVRLTDQSLDQMFQANEWATASWTLVTTPR